MSTGAGAAIAALFGAVLGSFLNVVAYRLPRKESLVRPPSRCPSCETPVKPYDNIPVLSWLILGGKCRSCGAPISKRYPLVEAATALLLALVVLDKGADRDAWLGIALVLLLIPVTLIDLEHRIIPNTLMIAGTIAAPAIVLATDSGEIAEHLISAFAAGGFFLLAALAYPAGMGMGDVKFAFVLGLFLGAAVAPALLIALLSGTVIGALLIARKGVQEGRKTAVPFGPFMALGALICLFAGDPIVDWYADNFL